jgi:hypothetical protein
MASSAGSSLRKLWSDASAARRRLGGERGGDLALPYAHISRSGDAGLKLLQVRLW